MIPAWTILNFYRFFFIISDCMVDIFDDILDGIIGFQPRQ